MSWLCWDYSCNSCCLLLRRRPRRDCRLHSAVYLHTPRGAGAGRFGRLRAGSVTPALNPSRGITIEAWVYRYNASRCETVVGMNYQVGYWLGFCSSKIRFYPHGSGSSLDGNADIPARVWTHIAVTYDGTTRRYYVNGELDFDSNALNGPLSFTNSNLGIGTDPANRL